MGANSIFTPGYAQYHKVGDGEATSKPGTGERSFFIDLDTQLLTDEHVIRVLASQARTTPATSCDVRKVFKSITLHLSGGPNSGDRISASGHAVDLLSRLTERQPNPEIDLTNGTADFLIDLHHLLDGSHMDMVSSVRMNLYTSGAKLTFVMNGTDNQLFSGGTAAGDVDVAVEVKAKDYQRELVGLDHYQSIAKFSHHFIGNSYNVNGVGAQQAVEVTCGKRRVRFVLLLAFNSSGEPSDSVVTNIKWTVGSHVNEYTFKELRRLTDSNRGVDLPGCVVIDMGDKPACFTPEYVAKAKLEWSAAADGRLEVVPVWIEPLVY